MSFGASLKDTEDSLIKLLSAKRSGIDDRTGKGSATERIVDEQLLIPYLRPGFKSQKGAVVEAARPDDQSPAIDRVVYDSTAASPLLHDEAHSIFAIESVCGLVEITMNLDATKLKEDIARMAPIKAMTRRRCLAPLLNSTTKVLRTEVEALPPRSFIVGLPADPTWSSQAIADALRRLQLEARPPTHVHGLYVIGVGFFETVPVDSPAEPMYRIAGWTGPDRLFRFTTGFRQAFDRWNSLPLGCTVDLEGYISGTRRVLAE